MSGKREYQIVIGGVKVGITDTTKLVDVVLQLDAAMAKVEARGGKVSSVFKQHKTATSDVNKESDRLAATYTKIEKAQSKQAKEQERANKQLRDAQRETKRQIAVEEEQEGSIRHILALRTQLREEYDKMSPAQREDIELGGEKLKQIQELDAQYKSLKATMGQYQDNVGNYPNWEKGFEQVKGGMQGLNGLFSTGIGVLAIFGDQSDDDAKLLQRLGKVIAIVNIAMTALDKLTKSNTLGLKARAASTTASTAATAANTAATTAQAGATTVADKATKSFTKSLLANPFTAIAIGVLALVSAIISLGKSTNKTSDEALKLQEHQRQLAESNKFVGLTSGQLDIEEAKLNAQYAQGVINLREYNTEMRKLLAGRVANAQMAMIEAKAEQEAAIKSQRHLGFWEKVGAGISGVWAYLTDKAGGYSAAVARITDTENNANSNVRETTQAYEEATVAYYNAETALVNFDKEVNNSNKQFGEQRQTILNTITANTRKFVDTQLALIQNNYDRERETTKESYKRQIEDLQQNLREQLKMEGLTQAEKEKIIRTINETILNLQSQQAIDLAAIDRREADERLAYMREMQDSELNLLNEGLDKRVKQVEQEYNKELDALKKRQEEDLRQGGEHQEEITQLIVNAEQNRQKKLDKIAADRAALRASTELREIEFAMRTMISGIDDIIARDQSSGGWFSGLIDVDKTLKNIEVANSATQLYIDNLKSYKQTLIEEHNTLIATMTVGSEEWEAEMIRFAEVMFGVEEKIRQANKSITENTKTANEVQMDSLREMLGKIAEYAQAMADSVTSVTDTISMGLEASIETLNTQLETINEKYDAAVSRRDEMNAAIAQTEENLRNSSEGTADAYRQQLADQMSARGEYEREEQRLAKEKEKREAELAKKERQLKRTQLIGNIAQAIAGAASAAINGLNMQPFIPLGLIASVTAGSMGLAQVAIMSRQLAKMEDGGEVKGALHADGGVTATIKGKPAYELEGGEFVVNRRAYANNRALVNFLNDYRAPVPFSTTWTNPNQFPITVTDTGNDTDRIVDAISSLEINPTVAVTDINRVNNYVADVTDSVSY